jgi:ACT domain-containing protein
MVLACQINIKLNLVRNLKKEILNNCKAVNMYKNSFMSDNYRKKFEEKASITKDKLQNITQGKGVHKVKISTNTFYNVLETKYC